MADPNLLLLSAIVFLPALGALIIGFVPRSQVNAIRYITLASTVAVLVISVHFLLVSSDTRFDAAVGSMQDAYQSIPVQLTVRQARETVVVGEGTVLFESAGIADGTQRVAARRCDTR